MTIGATDIGLFVDGGKGFAIEIDVTDITERVFGLFVFCGFGHRVLWAVRGIRAGYTGISCYYNETEDEGRTQVSTYRYWGPGDWVGF